MSPATTQRSDRKPRKAAATKTTQSPDEATATDQLDTLSAAELVTEGAKQVKAYGTLHGKQQKATRDLAYLTVHLRARYQNKDGRPDLRGTSKEYRDAAGALYARSGVPDDAANALRSLVRHYVSDALRQYMDSHGYTEADYKYYELDKDSSRTKKAAGLRTAASLRIDRKDLPGSTLRVLGTLDESIRLISDDEEVLGSTVAMTGDQRKELEDRLAHLEERITVIRTAMR